MNNKTNIEHNVWILNLILGICALGFFIATVVLSYTTPVDNEWRQITAAITIICICELSYSNGYLKGMRDEKIFSKRSTIVIKKDE